jgi:hypothetical protein
MIYSGQANKFGFTSGLTGLAKGWGPTLIGYSFQGICKYGFYEVSRSRAFVTFYSTSNMSLLKWLAQK